VLEEVLEDAVIVSDTMFLDIQGIVAQHANKYTLVPPLRIRVCLVQLFIICPLIQKYIGIVGVLDNKDSSINIAIPDITTKYEV